MRGAGKVVVIQAPMAGVAYLLDTVPDHAFAGRVIGDGIAIDPLDEVVRAPLAGTVAALAETWHAITIRSPDGVEILIHVGIDTVRLNRQGFKPLVSVGQDVAAGQDLIELDLDILATEAKSLLTPVIIVSNHRLLGLCETSKVVSSGEQIFHLIAEGCPSDGPVEESNFRSTAHINVELKLPHGLHARPSARIARKVQDFDGRVTVSLEDKSADASSVSALMALGARLGDEIEIRVVGDQCRQMALALAELLDQLAAGERDHAAASAGAKPVDRPASSLAVSDNVLSAVIASPGLAYGPVFRLVTGDLPIDEEGQGPEAEHRRLGKAINQLAEQLTGAIASTHGVGKAVAEAHLAIVQDRVLRDSAEEILVSGVSAEFAWRMASRAQEDALAATGSPRMRERVIDMRDVERRMIASMTGTDLAVQRMVPPGAILVCDDVEPSILLAMPKLGVAGICTALGGATSHAAILAGARGIPMLVAAGEAVHSLRDGQEVLLDALEGRLDATPLQATLREVAACAERAARDADAAKLDAQALCYLRDETRIEIFANLATLEDARDAVANGAEGCGLLRTEFIFADALEEPNEATQSDLYRQFASALGDRPLIIRTLDVGGDKPIAYLPFADEPNPALGMRGIRFTDSQPSILRTQLRAMLRAVPSKQLRIMLPMVVEAAEIDRVRKIVETEAAEIGITSSVEVGIMVETPAAALCAERLAAHADFLSIGTNDLSQYVLAMDRGNSALAGRVDSFHPAVLRAIELAAAGAARHGRWFGVCGGLASDYRAAPLLVGLGCNELSSVPNSIPRIKRTLSSWTMPQCRDLAARALALDSAVAVRALVSEEVQ